MFHLPSCSKPLQKLSQLPIGLPAQSVRALCPRQVSIFLAFLIHRYKNPTPSPTLYLQNVYRKCSISTTLRKNRGPRTVYRHTASCGSLSCPWCLTSTQFPLPLPTPQPGPCITESALVTPLVKTCEGGHRRSWKNAGRSLWMNFLLENGANTQKTKRRTFGITMVSILQVRRFLIQAEVLVRGLRTRCLYSVWKYLPSLCSLLHELVSKRPKNVKLC